jgi:uncharacterized protein YbbC (DUF1343 family)
LYKNDTNQSAFFNDFFDKLAGTNKLKQQIIAGQSEDEIRKTWQADLQIYKKTRWRYLLYADVN